MEYLILIISLAGIVLGADWLVGGSVRIARRFKVSDFVIGAAIVGVGTSAPELMVSLMGAIQGNSDVALGNVVGSNIFNVLGILGATAICFPVKIDKANLKFDIPLCIFLSVLLMLLAFNFFNGSVAVLGRIDGLILIGIFAWYMWYSFKGQKKQEAKTEETQAQAGSVWIAILKVVGGLAILVTSCDFFVDNAIKIARSWNMSEAAISITLIACGTSLPELAASITAALKKNTEMALGNIIGSNIFNITLILGVCSQVSPLSSAGITVSDYCVMIAAALLTLFLGLDGKINRWEGLLMFAAFVGYSIYLLG